jgi:hypothetical protein
MRGVVSDTELAVTARKLLLPLGAELARLQVPPEQVKERAAAQEWVTAALRVFELPDDSAYMQRATTATAFELAHMEMAAARRTYSKDYVTPIRRTNIGAFLIPDWS